MRKKRQPAIGGAADRIFVDTSAWIAFFSARDQHHCDADQAFRAAIAQNRKLLTTNLVVAELHRLLLFRAGHAAASAALDRIDSSSDRVTIAFADAAHHRGARAWLSRLKDRRLTYTDAVSFCVMESTRCRTALTYDSDFAAAGFAVSSIR